MDDTMVGLGTFKLIDKSTGTIWLQGYQPTGAITASAREAMDGYGYYGIWTVTTDPDAAPGSDAATPKRYAEWAGSKPYGRKPDEDLEQTAGSPLAN